MKSLSALSDFYYKNLYPELQRVEKERLALKNRLITAGVIYTTFALLLGSWLTQTIPSPDTLLFTLFAYFGLGGFLYKLLTKEFTQNFKERVIAPLIHSIDEKLNYTPHLHLDPNYVERSKIFTQTPDRVSGSDYVYGHIDGVEIKFSDLHLEKKHKDSKGRTSWSTLFKGLFIIADFHKNFHGTTVVLPDTAQSTFGSLIGSWLQSYNVSRDQLIKMDNVAFEEAFVVYGSDQIESRYILTPALMQRILELKRKTQTQLLLSFTNANIHIAIEYNKNLFEPSIFRSLLEYKIAMEYIEVLHLATSIVEELKLNQKLWSKK